MKHYIYIDKEILNSYISQIYGGILERGKSEKELLEKESQEITSPEEKIKAAVKGGIPGILNGDIETEYDLKDKLVKGMDTSNASKEVIEKIYHDNLLDNLIGYIHSNEKVIRNISDIQYGKYVELSLPFDFVIHSYIKSISNNEFKKSFEKIMNVTSPGKDKTTKDAKFAMELIGNFATFFESCFPAKQLIISDNLIIPLDDQFLREKPEMIDFKYGGNIVVIGKVTKDCSKDINVFGLYNKEFGNSIEEVKQAMYNVFLPNYKRSFIITPIALYFE